MTKASTVAACVQALKRWRVQGRSVVNRVPRGTLFLSRHSETNTQSRVRHGKYHLRVCLCVTTNNVKVTLKQNPTHVTKFAVSLTRKGMQLSNSD